ncbi:MAG: hypothetical protein LBG73_01755 [Spirochaetaceae bacterium]|jgi:hypothetical protein|nr:hypothetical protein [Spirochaetaceae bacterium]
MDNDEALQCFLDELGAIRIELKEINRKLRNTEKIISYAFPRFKELARTKPVQASLDEVDFKQLKSTLKASKNQYVFQEEIERYPDNIVFAFAEYLGIDKTTDRDEAFDKIGKKLNASLATGIGSNRQSARKCKSGNPPETPKPELNKHNDNKSPTEEADQDKSGNLPVCNSGESPSPEAGKDGFFLNGEPLR